MIDISPATGSDIPEAVVRLDTTEESVHLVQGSLPGAIRTGTEIVDIEASVYAIDVSPAGSTPPDPLPQVRIQKLDVVSVIPSSGMTLAEEGFRSVVGADIVEIEESLLQGVALHVI